MKFSFLIWKKCNLVKILRFIEVENMNQITITKDAELSILRLINVYLW